MVELVLIFLWMLLINNFQKFTFSYFFVNSSYVNVYSIHVNTGDMLGNHSGKNFLEGLLSLYQCQNDQTYTLDNDPSALGTSHFVCTAPLHTPAEGDFFSDITESRVLLPGVLFTMQNEVHDMACAQLGREDPNACS